MGGYAFSDRVMAAVASEPRPTPTRVFMRSILHLSPRDASAAVLTAWRLAFRPTPRVRPALRAQSMALLLGVLIVVGLGGPFAASNGLGLLRSVQPPGVPAATPPAVTTDEATPAPTVIPVTPIPSLEPSPEPTAETEKPVNKPKTTKSTPKAAPDAAPSRPQRKTAEPEDREDRKDREDKTSKDDD
jgi:outer membrane biosynthesis protein TonB